MDILFSILMLIYCYAGDKANYYLKYHLLGQRAEIYGDTGNYIIGRIIWATLLGWATIPLAMLHKIFLNRG